MSSTCVRWWQWAASISLFCINSGRLPRTKINRDRSCVVVTAISKEVPIFCCRAIHRVPSTGQ